MAVKTYLYRFIVSNVLTTWYCAVVLIKFALYFIKNPFKHPWAMKLKLEPPQILSDPKFGVHKYIKANNIKLHYVENGDPSKPLMLFLHGFPEFWYSWRYQLVEFSKDYWCVAVDMRGYGDSERPEDVSFYHIDILIEDVRDLIRQLGREKCILVAHDWGGLIASRFRDVHSDVLNALVIVGSTSREAWYKHVWSSCDQLMKSWYVFFYRAPGLPERLLQMNNLSVFDQIMMVPGKDTITKNDIDCYKYWFGKQFALTPPINYYRMNFQLCITEKVKCEKNIPFLAVNGEKDAFLNRELLDTMKEEEYAYLETKIIENCGHFLQQEEPEKVNKLIREFLAKHGL